MTDKEKLNLRIQELTMEVYQWTPHMYEIQKGSVSARIEGAVIITTSIALLKLLIWASENLFNDEGRFSLPITKWYSVIKKVKEFLKSIL